MKYLILLIATLALFTTPSTHAADSDKKPQAVTMARSSLSDWKALESMSLNDFDVKAKLAFDFRRPFRA